MVFKEEYVSILGLLPIDLHQEILNPWIKQKILDIIEMTDRSPNKIVQNSYEEPWNREQEEEDDNDENVDECRSIWDFLQQLLDSNLYRYSIFLDHTTVALPT